MEADKTAGCVRGNDACAGKWQRRRGVVVDGAVRWVCGLVGSHAAADVCGLAGEPRRGDRSRGLNTRSAGPEDGRQTDNRRRRSGGRWWWRGVCVCAAYAYYIYIYAMPVGVWEKRVL